MCSEEEEGARDFVAPVGVNTRVLPRNATAYRCIRARYLGYYRNGLDDKYILSLTNARIVSTSVAGVVNCERIPLFSEFAIANRHISIRNESRTIVQFLRTFINVG